MTEGIECQDLLTHTAKQASKQASRGRPACLCTGTDTSNASAALGRAGGAMQHMAARGSEP